MGHQLMGSTTVFLVATAVLCRRTRSRPAAAGCTRTSARRTSGCRPPRSRAKGLPVVQARALIEQHVQGRTLGFLGEPRVNVLLLNLALDAGRTVVR